MINKYFLSVGCLFTFLDGVLRSTKVFNFVEVRELILTALYESGFQGQVWKQESSCYENNAVVQVRGVLALSQAWPQSW